MNRSGFLLMLLLAITATAACNAGNDKANGSPPPIPAGQVETVAMNGKRISVVMPPGYTAVERLTSDQTQATTFCVTKSSSCGRQSYLVAVLPPGVEPAVFRDLTQRDLEQSLRDARERYGREGFSQLAAERTVVAGRDGLSIEVLVASSLLHQFLAAELDDGALLIVEGNNDISTWPRGELEAAFQLIASGIQID